MMSALSRLGIDQCKSASPAGYSAKQDQTKETFGFKWSRQETYENEKMLENTKKWLFERYCDNDPEKLNGWLEEGGGGSKLILDAGCGAAFSALLFFGDLLKKHDYLGVDISDAVFVAQSRFADKGYPGEFLQTSLLDLPVQDNTIDMIFSEGVLHHTDNTESSISYLARKIKAGGLFLFYVYRKKAVLREFTDDYIRSAIAPMTNEEAWEALKPLTKLGKTLGELAVTITVEEDVPFLGIKKGSYDLQRFIYWNICKLYYRPEYDIEEMNHINFDWFRPLNCHRHTVEEIKRYCDRAGLSIEHLNEQEAGITVVARKQ